MSEFGSQNLVGIEPHSILGKFRFGGMLKKNSSREIPEKLFYVVRHQGLEPGTH